jgi:hypothetical protein
MFPLNERSERPGSMRLEALIGANLPAARPSRLLHGAGSHRSCGQIIATKLASGPEFLGPLRRGKPDQASTAGLSPAPFTISIQNGNVCAVIELQVST